MRRSKIIATVGPASESAHRIEKLIRAGVDLFRLNFSHGSPEERRATVVKVQNIARRLTRPIGIIGDIQGPKVRIGTVPGGKAELKKGETVLLREAKSSDSAGIIPVPHNLGSVAAGERVLLRDGLIVLKVLSVAGGDISCRVIDGGTITTASGISAPHIAPGVAAVTKKDRADIKSAVALDLDWLAISFVGRASDLRTARRAAATSGKKIPLIAKIERSEAVNDIDAILAVSDAVMVARGDLALEVPLEKVPIIQKRIIGKARAAGVPSIVATQMLESMVDELRPTRAEATDVATAIFDGADATMLSEETAVGSWPVVAVRTMSAIARAAQESGIAFQVHPPAADDGVLLAIARAVQDASEYAGAKAIIVFTLSGRTARAISALRPPLPIYALTPDAGVYRAMTLFWGVEPVLIQKAKSTDHMLKLGAEALIKGRHLRKGALIIAVSGTATVGGATNMMRICRL